MVLKPEAIRARLLKLEEVISRLEQLQTVDIRRGFRDAWAVERGLQLAAEVVFDIGNHILSAHFGVSAQDYESILEQLSVQGVIPPDLRQQLKGLGGFRNILVHDYLRLDPDAVEQRLRQAPGDFSALAIAIRAWLDSHTEPP